MADLEDPERQPLVDSSDRKFVRIVSDVEERDFDATPNLSHNESTASLSKYTPKGHDKVNDVLVGRLKTVFRDMGESKVLDTMTYEVSAITNWRSALFLGGAHTALGKRTTWMMALKLLILSLVVAASVVVSFIRDGASIDIKSSKFKDIASFLQLFVAMMLGFYLSSSVNRWYTCVDGFMQLFDAIRNLQMQFHALGASPQRVYTCIRYGVLSGLVLGLELQIRLKKNEEKANLLRDMFDELELLDGSVPHYQHGQYRSISSDERALLERVQDPTGDLTLSGNMWMWVATLVGRMAQDGEIPPMASPTYGRIMNLCQNAHAGIRAVKSTVKVQAPFAYAHTLAVLVHVNNILSAMSFGVTLGLTMCKLRTTDSSAEEKLREVALRAGMEDLFVSFVCGMLGPFIYQILLDVCISIAMPFENKEATIPTDKLLTVLEKDLYDAMHMFENPISWEPPSYNTLPPPTPKPPS